jgi:putative intracellular protease/amidase
MPKILMPIGDGVEALDTFYAYYRLPEDGFEIEAPVVVDGMLVSGRGYHENTELLREFIRLLKQTA